MRLPPQNPDGSCRRKKISNVALPSNAALAEISAKAEAATSDKSEFLAKLSHENRKPMTAILGFADLLLEHGAADKNSSDQNEALETIRSNGRYLLNLINEILDLSKIEAGKFELERTTCSPVTVLAEVESLMRVRAEAKGIAFGVSCRTPIPQSIECDPTRLRQISINLVGNAVKLTEVGGVGVSTSLLEDLGTPPRLRFDVTDSGIGMIKDQVSRLLRPFVQADSSTTREYGAPGWADHQQAIGRDPRRRRHGREQARQGKHLCIDR